MGTSKDQQRRDAGAQDEGDQEQRTGARKGSPAQRLLAGQRADDRSAADVFAAAQQIAEDTPQRFLMGMGYTVADLEKLREPFTETEKLPKPMWKGAWNEGRKGRCDECGGYHCLSNTIHLDYVGHAEVTRRLLDVDPWWDWEPLAYDDKGLPLFDRFGGLWISLTVCGVTRKGYGDATGKEPGSTAVKEIIGDAIRNAAMRFGVALDLWSKLDRHEGKNPGATYDSGERQTQTRVVQGNRQVRGEDPQEPPRENQAALDALESVCKKHGYSNQYCIDRFAEEHDGEHIRDADEGDIFDFADALIAEATAEPAVGDSGTPADESADKPPADDEPPF